MDCHRRRRWAAPGAFSVHRGWSWARAGLGPGTSFQHLSVQMLLRGMEEVGVLGPREVRGQ